MSDNKLHLGHSPITGNIYLGRQSGNHWAGEKRNVTSEFLEILLQKFEPGTIQNIAIDGENKYRMFVVGMDEKITINGKTV